MGSSRDVPFSLQLMCWLRDAAVACKLAGSISSRLPQSGSHLRAMPFWQAANVADPLLFTGC